MIGIIIICAFFVQFTIFCVRVIAHDIKDTLKNE